MLERLKENLVNAEVVDFNGYDYFVFPIADGIPSIEPELLEEVVSAMAAAIESDYDRIVTAEAMGMPLAAGLSLKTGKPFTVIRKRKYGLPDEVAVNQETGYSSRKLYINGLKKGDRIVFVDDVISTGGTLRCILTALRTLGVEVTGIVIAINKGKGKAKLEKEFGITVRTLVNIGIRNGKVVLLPD